MPCVWVRERDRTKSMQYTVAILIVYALAVIILLGVAALDAFAGDGSIHVEYNPNFLTFGIVKDNTEAHVIFFPTLAVVFPRVQ